MTIELKIQVSSPDMLRDTLMAFGAVFGSGLVKPTDQVTLTATETSSPATEIEAWIDQAPDAQLPEEFAAATEPDPEPVSQPEKIEEVEPEPAPKKRGRPRKSAAAVEPVPDVEPEPEVVTEEEEPEAIGADEPPAPEPAPAPPPASVKPTASAKPPKAQPVELTMDDLRGAVKRIMDQHGIPETLKRLGKVGFKKASDVPPEHFETAINALLDEG